MLEDVPSLADLLTRARQGCDDAATRLHRLFTPSLLAVAHRCLSRHLRSKEDPEDVVQNVWREFFAHVPEPDRFPDTDHLRGWLATMTRRRALDVNRRYLGRPTHDIRRECPLEGLPPRQGSTLAVGPRRLWGADLEDLQALRGDGLSLSRAERTCALLLWYGASVRLIAVHLGVSEKTVRRVLAGLARRGGIYEAPAAKCG